MKYHNNPDPAAIEREAQAELSLEMVHGEWVVGAEPEKHIEEIEKLFESGATIVNIHSGQKDQMRVIDFYGSSVLPKVGARIH